MATRQQQPTQQVASNDVMQQLLKTLNGMSEAISTLTQRQAETDAKMESMLRAAAAPQIFTTGPTQPQASPAVVLAGAQVVPTNVKLDIARERRETMERLRRQPKTSLLIEEPYSCWHGGIKIIFGPRGKFMPQVPIEIAQLYTEWRRRMSEITQFNDLMRSAGGGTGMLNSAFLDAILGHDGDMWVGA